MRSIPNATPPCGGCTGSEGTQEESEFPVDLLVLETEDPEDLTLHLRIVVSEASRTELDSVVDQIVREPSRLTSGPNRGVQSPRDAASRTDGGSRRVRPSGTRLEHREVHDPEPRVLPVLLDVRERR